MSRIGKKPIAIPTGITVEQKDNKIFAKGPKGELSCQINPEIEVKIQDGKIFLERKIETISVRALHGLMGSLINNMIIGVDKGFEKDLEMSGVGYKASISGKELILSVGYSHPVKFQIPEGVEIKIEDQSKVKVSGKDKCLVGKIASEIRAIKPCDPYKAKGIKYKDEVIRRKAGKALKAGKAA